MARPFTADDLLDCYRRGVFPMARRARRSAAVPGRSRRGAASCRWTASTSRAAWRARVRTDRFEIRDRHGLRRGDRRLRRAAARTKATPGSTRRSRRSTASCIARGLAHSVEAWRDGTAGRRPLWPGARRRLLRREHVLGASATPARSPSPHLVERLRAGGFVLLDAQFMTDHLRSFGAVEIDRADYQRRLAAALALRRISAPPAREPRRAPSAR